MRWLWIEEVEELVVQMGWVWYGVEDEGGSEAKSGKLSR